MSDSPETLESYARIFEMRRRHIVKYGERTVAEYVEPDEACLAAARALRFMATATRQADAYLLESIKRMPGFPECLK